VKDGVLVGCDENQEWILPWWWSHYSQHSFLPVAFADFGMSAKAKNWCQDRGILVTVDDFTHLKRTWNRQSGWFKKPLAMKKTPFDRTLWTDLDCEIVGSITPLFQKIHSHSGIAMARDLVEEVDEPVYNAGVVVFMKDSPVIQTWEEICLHQSHRFLSDQAAINFLIQEEEVEISELPAIYNWRVSFGVNIEAIILHWSGAWGKEIIHLAMQRN
jgi:hypothetical protein